VPEEDKKVPNGDEKIDKGSYTNKPKPEMRKATYLSPSDENYTIEIWWLDPRNPDPQDSKKHLTGKETLNSVLLTHPLQIIEFLIFRDKDDNVVIKEGDRPDPNTADPDDLGKPPELDPDETEGSNPAVIPEGSRNRLGYFIVKNMTNSQIVEKVEFTMGAATYSIGQIRVNDTESISLRSGQWTTSLSYNPAITPLSRNINVFSASDTQAPYENNLYFYLNNKNEYKLSSVWPPVPNDVNENDMLPLDPDNNGRGVIKIINNSQGAVMTVSILKYVGGIVDSSKNPPYLYTDFIPAVPVQNGNTGYVNVVGDNEFPIEAINYLVEVDLETAEGGATIRRLGFLKDTVFTITINEKDILTSGNGADDGQGQIGSTIAVKNETTIGDYEIVGMVIKSKDGAGRKRQFNDTDQEWNVDGLDRGGPVAKDKLAKVLVKENSHFFIMEGESFSATLLVRNKENDTIREVKPSIGDVDLYLYGTRPREVRGTVVLRDPDIIGATMPEQKYVTLRIYVLDAADKIKQVWLDEAPIPNGWSTAEDNCKTINGLPHNDRNIKLAKQYTGHSGERVTSGATNNYVHSKDETFISSGILRGSYTVADFGACGIGNEWRDIRLPLPDNGKGWYVYFRTYSNWFIGYTNPGINAPGPDRNLRFFIEPRALMDTKDQPNPEDRYYIYVDNAKVKPRALEENDSGRSAERVIPIGHTQYCDLTSIMKTPKAAVNGIRYLIHDAN
jgi:hypothetical protein